MKKEKMVSAVVCVCLLAATFLSCSKNKSSQTEENAELEEALAEAENARLEAERAREEAAAAKREAEKARVEANSAKKAFEKAQKENENSKIVNASWDFEKGEKASKDATILSFGSNLTSLEKDLTLPCDSGTGATLVFVKSKHGIKYNKGLQVLSGKTEAEIAKITVDKACTLIVTGRGSTSKTEFIPGQKHNILAVNGTVVYNRNSADETSNQTWRIPLNKGENSISASGMRFVSFVCE